MKTGTSTEPRLSRQSIADGRIHTLTGDTFSSLVLNGEGPMVVEFMSYGCAYCRALEPALVEVAGILKSKEAIFRVNIAVDQELADQYEIHGTPTMIMFLNGQEVGRVEGAQPEDLLRALTAPFDSPSSNEPNNDDAN
jgi:thioredoxin 1